MSSLAWEATTSAKHKLCWCCIPDERYWHHFFVVLLPCSLLCSLPPSLNAGQLEKGTLRIKGTVNRAQVAKKSYRDRCPVQTLASVDRAAVWVENFVGGKFHDTGVNHRTMKISIQRKQLAIRYILGKIVLNSGHPQFNRQF